MNSYPRLGEAPPRRACGHSVQIVRFRDQGDNSDAGARKLLLDFSYNLESLFEGGTWRRNAICGKRRITATSSPRQ